VSDDTGQRLPELVLIDRLEELARAYRSRHGRYPINVSHWNPSAETIRALKSSVPVQRPGDPVPYQYSYLINRKPEILSKLGIPANKASALLTENGSASITAVANWLWFSRIRHVTLLQPCYFTIGHSLRRLGITVREVAVPRTKAVYTRPTDHELGSGDALWLTNPIYNTGVYALDDHLPWLLRLADAGVIIIADEAVAITPTRIASEFGGHPNFIGIYTPHKSICINALKFSAIACHPSHEDAFDDWADVLSGGLSLSATAAMDHFLSTNFDLYKIEFVRLIERTRAWHGRIITPFRPAIDTDTGASGHFVSVYLPGLEADLGNDIDFLAKVMEETGAAIIPGTRSGFDPSLGLCFRINLAQDSPQFRSAVSRLYRFLSLHSSG
jgi:histidinol-phosphate/aromatic aminotransferase/cobyric acid decarboxylase-like protein